MSIVVTTTTILLGVLTGELLQFSCLWAVTISADASEHVGHRNPAWSMWILMAIEAVNMLGSVGLTMTGCTLWHNFSVVFLQRIVGVKNFMTLAAVKLM